MYEEIKPGIYRHYKGNRYQVLFLARHSENEEMLVVYKALYGAGEIWARPASMWQELVNVGGMMQPRFAWEGEA